MTLRAHLDAGIIVADVLWLVVTMLLVLAAQPTEPSLLRPTIPVDDTFRFLWQAVSVGLVVITGVWMLETVARVAGTRF